MMPNSQPRNQVVPSFLSGSLFGSNVLNFSGFNVPRNEEEKQPQRGNGDDSINSIVSMSNGDSNVSTQTHLLLS
jgi:hypothetical protein